MDMHRAEEVKWADAPAQHFTGRAQFGMGLNEEGLNALAVRFEAGARTDWHHHPRGQVLYVVEGSGRIQEEGGDSAEFEAGDAIYTPPGRVHWHGAGPDGSMQHISLTTGEDATIWHPRKVTDEEYNHLYNIQLPREKDIMFNVLQALGAVGGSGKAREVIVAIRGSLGVTQEQWSSKVKSGIPRIEDRTRWASDKLKNIGCIVKEKGVWISTNKGKDFLFRSQQETTKDLNEELWSEAMEYKAGVID